MASSGNFCTLNPLGAHGGGTPDFGTLSGGNLSCTLGDAVFGNFGVTSGKWYWEWAMTGSSTSGMAVGWANQQVNTQAELGYNSPSSATGAQMVYMYLSKNPPEIISDAPKSASSGTDTSMSEISQNDIIGVAADFDNDKWYFSINGSFTNARSGQDPASGTNPLCSASSGGGLVTISRTTGYTWFPAMGNWAAGTRDIKANFGQDSTFSGSFSAGGNADENGFGDFKYSVPAGFKAMCSGNLPISDDIDPAQTDDNFPQKQFNAVTYTGTGSTRSVSNLNFQPDLLWLKCRSIGQSGRLIDSSRGVSKTLTPADTQVEGTESNGITSFDSDGFTIGSSTGGFNTSSATYVGWAWRCNGGTEVTNNDGTGTSYVQANQNAGFSIVRYAGTGSALTIGHGLAQEPDITMIKDRDASVNWIVYTKIIDGSLDYLFLNTTAGKADSGLTGPNSSIWNFNSASSYSNTSSRNYIMYNWHSVEGYSKFGIYTANDNADGPFIYTGFRPRLLVIRNTTLSGDGWRVYDTARSTHNPATVSLAWNADSAEYSSSSVNPVDFLSNGFKVRSSNAIINNTGYDPYIYMAWGDVPAKYGNTF